MMIKVLITASIRKMQKKIKPLEFVHLVSLMHQGNCNLDFKMPRRDPPPNLALEELPQVRNRQLKTSPKVTSSP